MPHFATKRKPTNVHATLQLRPFPMKQHIPRNLIIKLGEERYKCGVAGCPKSFRGEPFLEKHLILKHPECLQEPVKNELQDSMDIERSNSNTTIAEVLDDIIISYILPKLKPLQLLSLSQVSRRFRELVHKPVVWQQQYSIHEKVYPILLEGTGNRVTDADLLECFSNWGNVMTMILFTRTVETAISFLHKCEVFPVNSKTGKFLRIPCEVINVNVINETQNNDPSVFRRSLALGVRFEIHDNAFTDTIPLASLSGIPPTLADAAVRNRMHLWKFEQAETLIVIPNRMSDRVRRIFSTTVTDFAGKWDDNLRELHEFGTEESPLHFYLHPLIQPNEDLLHRLEEKEFDSITGKYFSMNIPMLSRPSLENFLDRSILYYDRKTKILTPGFGICCNIRDTIFYELFIRGTGIENLPSDKRERISRYIEDLFRETFANISRNDHKYVCKRHPGMYQKILECSYE